jgi:hypothetical protein
MDFNSPSPIPSPTLKTPECFASFKTYVPFERSPIIAEPNGRALPEKPGTESVPYPKNPSINMMLSA